MAECVVLTMGGKDGVPLRFPRPVAALVAIVAAAVTVGLSVAPATADQVRQQEWWLSALNVTGAWTASQGSGVTVAVLSDGVDTGHPDLTGVVTTAPATPGAPVAAGQFFGEQGTPIASLIAGHGDGSGGSSGIIGVAPAAHILSVAVTLPPDDGQLYQTSVAAAIPSAIAAGIRYAVSHGASVIDLPIDPGQPSSNGLTGDLAAAGGSTAEQSAVSYALAHNVVLVAPAGDDALATDAPNYPAAYQGVIAVGAFNSAFDKAPWTSRQSYVTMTAAGAGVIAASNSGGYATINSTSAASAVVAGVVALIRSRYPNLSVAKVRTALTTTTMYHRANGLTDGSGYGAVNAAAALGAAATLATSAQEQAGAGAEPLATLGPAAAGAGASKLSPQIVRAAEISVGVLVLLLLAVAAYAVTGRRRRRRVGTAPVLAAEWTAGQAQSRYPHAVVVPTDADRILQYFGPPGNAPADAGAQLATPARPAAAAALPPRSENDEEKVFVPPAAAGAPNSWGPYGAASSAVARRAPVSGTPPWEPAAPPSGALSWSDTPGRQMVAGHVVASGPAARELDSADTAPVSRQRLDWHPANESPGSGQPGRESQAPRTAPALSPRAAGPGHRRATASRPSRPTPAAWSGSAGVGAPVGEADPGASDQPALASPSTAPAHAGPSGQHRSGLPIRQPRSVSPGPASPSGSLWEPAAGGGSLWESGDRAEDTRSPDTRADSASRPMFVWQPPAVSADGEARHSAD
jgi:subtilisin family serine protease